MKGWCLRPPNQAWWKRKGSHKSSKPQLRRGGGETAAATPAPALASPVEGPLAQGEVVTAPTPAAPPSNGLLAKSPVKPSPAKKASGDTEEGEIDDKPNLPERGTEVFVGGRKELEREIGR